MIVLTSEILDIFVQQLRNELVLSFMKFIYIKFVAILLEFLPKLSMQYITVGTLSVQINLQFKPYKWNLF